jgi:hypothetical protein
MKRETEKEVLEEGRRERGEKKNKFLRKGRGYNRRRE